MKDIKLQQTLLFLISKSDGIPLFIHPFRGEKCIGSSENIEGRYGIVPEVDSTVLLRNSLYSEADREVQDWSAEQHFFPRFSISLVIFFLVFFFMAWVVRDTIPLIDELLVSTASAIVSYVFIGRRFTVSKSALEKKILLKKRIDAISFKQKQYMIAIENIFRDLNKEDTLKYSELANRVVDLRKMLSPSDFEELEEFLATLNPSPRRIKKIHKALQEGRLPKTSVQEELLYIIVKTLFLEAQRISPAQID